MSEQCKQVESFISRYRLIQAGDIVVLAVSGGIDSVVMAHLLMGLRERLDFQPVLANFNHKLRSEAEEEMSFVAQLAQDWGVPFHGGSADIGKLAIGHNLQDVARRERYAFLRQVAFRYNGAFIATAHHRDDQAETVLLHFCLLYTSCVSFGSMRLDLTSYLLLVKLTIFTSIFQIPGRKVVMLNGDLPLNLCSRCIGIFWHHEDN